MYKAIYRNEYDVHRAAAVHHQRLRKAKPIIDMSEPQEQPHLLSKAKKHEMEEDRFAEIERENAILLAKMSKIMREGSGTENIGGAPPLQPRKPARPAVGSLNRARRKQELMRITQENQAILKRIQLKDPHYNHLEWAQSRRDNIKYMRQHCVHPPPGTKKQESKFARQLRGRVGKGSVTARGAGGSQRRTVNMQRGAITERARGGDAAAAPLSCADRVSRALDMIKPDDLRLLLGMKRPPEIVKTVFGSLMIIVSPFETTESDISWGAVHEWVRQLQGVDSFLENLHHFDAAKVAPPIVQSALDYMSTANLYPSNVKKFSGALATLCTWVWCICEASQPDLTATYRLQSSSVEEVLQSGQGDDASDEADYGFANGEQVGSSQRLPAVEESGTERVKAADNPATQEVIEDKVAEDEAQHDVEKAAGDGEAKADEA